MSAPSGPQMSSAARISSPRAGMGSRFGAPSDTQPLRNPHCFGSSANRASSAGLKSQGPMACIMQFCARRYGARFAMSSAQGSAAKSCGPPFAAIASMLLYVHAANVARSVHGRRPFFLRSSSVLMDVRVPTVGVAIRCCEGGRRPSEKMKPSLELPPFCTIVAPPPRCAPVRHHQRYYPDACSAAAPSKDAALPDFQRLCPRRPRYRLGEPAPRRPITSSASNIVLITEPQSAPPRSLRAGAHTLRSRRTMQRCQAAPGNTSSMVSNNLSRYRRSPGLAPLISNKRYRK